jgi:hypothetical protein
VTLTDLADGANDGAFAGTAGPALGAAIDDTDVVHIFSAGPNGLAASRFGPDGTRGVSTSLGGTTQVAGAATLARHATAVVSATGGQIIFTTAIWP